VMAPRHRRGLGVRLIRPNVTTGYEPNFACQVPKKREGRRDMHPVGRGGTRTGRSVP
jgi:hypothetical protein